MCLCVVFVCLPVIVCLWLGAVRGQNYVAQYLNRFFVHVQQLNAVNNCDEGSRSKDRLLLAKIR